MSECGYLRGLAFFERRHEEGVSNMYVNASVYFFSVHLSFSHFGDVSFLLLVHHPI